MRLQQAEFTPDTCVTNEELIKLKAINESVCLKKIDFLFNRNMTKPYDISMNI